MLRGDNSLRADGTFAEGEIIGVVGVVGAVERRGRRVWFGAGRLGPVVALIVRTGLVRRLNEVAVRVYRWSTRARGLLRDLRVG